MRDGLISKTKILKNKLDGLENFIIDACVKSPAEIMAMYDDFLGEAPLQTNAQNDSSSSLSPTSPKRATSPAASTRGSAASSPTSFGLARLFKTRAPEAGPTTLRDACADVLWMLEFDADKTSSPERKAAHEQTTRYDTLGDLMAKIYASSVVRRAF